MVIHSIARLILTLALVDDILYKHEKNVLLIEHFLKTNIVRQLVPKTYRTRTGIQSSNDTQ